MNRNPKLNGRLRGPVILSRGLTAAALAALLLSAAAGPAEAQSRDQIRIVGSSTVYPFATKVAEQFGRTSSFKTPVVESTGTGGGMQLFCSGVGIQYPDITNASRIITPSERRLCASNGVEEIGEAEIGFDGIVLASSKQAPRLSITRKQLFLALAKEVPTENGKMVPNPYKSWNEIDPSLPATKIEVLGPPPTSGTRDAFAELGLEAGCKSFSWLRNLAKADSIRFRRTCQAVREDGVYVEAGENDNLIIQKLLANPNAFGIFGFSFLDANRDKIQGSIVDGREPTFENIADGTYPMSRPLFFYVKKAHLGVIPGLKEYVQEFMGDSAMGEYGYLLDIGLVPQEELVDPCKAGITC